jgi:hypothetical protein
MRWCIYTAATHVFIELGDLEHRLHSPRGTFFYLVAAPIAWDASDAICLRDWYPKGELKQRLGEVSGKLRGCVSYCLGHRARAGLCLCLDVPPVIVHRHRYKFGRGSPVTRRMVYTNICRVRHLVM